MAARAAPPRSDAPRQRGAVLIVSLLMLLVLTLLGMTALQTARLDEQMTGNARDRLLALQAAEAALREAEAELESLTDLGAFATVAGFYAPDDVPPAPYAADTWTDAKSRAASALGGTASTPRYYIQLLGTDTAGGRLNLQGYGKTSMGGGVHASFLITARGTGGSDIAQVVLRSHYGRVF